MNTPPTIESVRAKLERKGALFAADEVRVLVEQLEAAQAAVAQTGKIVLKRGEEIDRQMRRAESAEEQNQTLERQRDRYREAHARLEEQLEAAQEAVRLRDESDDYRVLRLERLLAQHGIDLPPGFRTAPTQSGASAEGDEAGLGGGDAGDAGAAHLADSPASFPAMSLDDIDPKDMGDGMEATVEPGDEMTETDLDAFDPAILDTDK